MNPGSETFTVVLRRDNPQQSWGFRLQGGTDFTTPLSVSMVNPGSLAEQHGIKAGDAVLQINDKNSDELEHEAAKYEIMRSGNQVHFLLQRGEVKIWRPKVTPMTDLKPGEMRTMPEGFDPATQYVQKTSLAADKGDPCRIGSAHNRSARPFPGSFTAQQSAPPPQPPAYQQQPQAYAAPPGVQQQNYGSQPPAYGGGQQAGGQHGGYGGAEFPPDEPQDESKALIHSQYNTPINMYSAGNIAESYSGQAQAIDHTMQSLNISDSTDGTPVQAAPPGDEGQHISPATRSTIVVKPTAHKLNQSPSGVSPTFLAIKEHEKITGESFKTGIEDGGSNANKQSRSFRLLEQGLNNTELSDVSGGAGSVAGMRSVKAPTTKPPSEKTPAQYMTCKACGMLCTGVFVKIKGNPMHPECFKCVKCGVGLKNIGYFTIEDQLYCETHARQVAKPPGPNMVATPVYR